MRALLDSHAFLWWCTDDPRLSAPARALIGDGTNEILVSAASAREIALKARLGRLRVPSDFERFMTEQLALNDFSVLAVGFAHAIRVHALADHHRDPFARLLAAQSLVERIPIIGHDRALAACGVELIC